MGRGSRTKAQASAPGGAAPTLRSAAVPQLSAAAALRRSLMRGGGAQRVESLLQDGPSKVGTKEERKAARGSHVRDMMEAATQISQDSLSTQAGARDLFRAYASAPDYSLNNLLLASIQLRMNGVDPVGMKFSRTAWNALGRQIKPEYAEPMGEQRGESWDSRYAVRMFSPKGFMKTLKEELDDKGQPKKIFIPGSFTTFTAYHEDATEAIGGGPAPELPQTPWSSATGSDEDAGNLLDGLEHICGYANIKLVDADIKPAPRNSQMPAQPAPLARLSDGELQVQAGAPIADRATAAVGALSQHFGRPLESERAERLGISNQQLDEAASEATAYVLASMFNLQSDDHTFPHLRDFAESEARTRVLTGEVHHRVGQILNYLDPARERKAEHNLKIAAEKSKERAAKRAEQAENGVPARKPRARRAPAKKRASAE